MLDNAMLADVARVRIVHGFGTGALRRAIAELLSRHAAVEKFYPAEQHDGGGGATIVDLKS
jgi:DNA mismatch repair protein MutS2